MVHIENLSFEYARSPFRLAVPELRIVDGACAAFVGPSGSGKTTLLNLLAGILRPRAGTIRIGETVVNELPDGQRRDFRIGRVGLVFQDFELIEYLNVRDNILLPCFINSSQPLTDEHKARANTLAEAMGVGDKLTRPIQRLSQGERQRVAICRALLTEPELLLADEPTGNLDPANKSHIVHLLTEYARDQGATLVVVTHDHSLLDEFDPVIDFADFLQATSAP